MSKKELNIKEISKYLGGVKSNIDIDKLNELTFDLSIEKKEEIKDLLEKKGIEVRICSKCGNFFNVGYCAYGGYKYFCSDECLHSVYSEAEWEKMCAYLIDEDERTKNEQKWADEYGDTESYFTEWC